ncbi:MAG: hypothetical protein A2X05_10930 [Bacteroidetes bacterium GWE2_41_25]|nr:MAG: hypothetical protein A2X05_10930 [Bacteroidetes bacterium GWE2_41_25]HCU20266.1 hypothetical protein [Bacteroidales bacterium]
MLPFGSLLTQVPLIIIGALYMLYLGLYAINKSKERSCIADSGVVEQTESRDSVDNSNSFYFINDYSRDKNDAIDEKALWIGFYESYFDKADIIPDSEIYSHFFTFCLFSRPPPGM